MGNRFAAGKKAIAECDRCGQRFLLKVLKTEIIKTKKYDLLVCPECWDPDHPQLQLGMWPVDDPQALRNPRPDRSYVVSGTSGVQIDPNAGTGFFGTGTNEGGSRIFQWGWNPVGGAQGSDAGLTPNVLAMAVQIGTVTVATT
jgi:DNA-directed RNA polymerase subunit RPC12/RpoP